MLRSLLIENFAIIEKLEINFEKGFSVITGETGAGKSIILGALGLVLGQRADSKTIRDGSDKCIIEATFEIADYQLNDFFNEHELDYYDNCLIRREILSNGKSRSFVNDTPINLNDLKELGGKLIDIHSQHENLLLQNKQFQLHVIDLLANNEQELNEYQTYFSEFKKKQAELGEFITFAEKSAADKDYLSHQLKQLLEAQLKENEKEELEEEQQKLSHTEEIKTELAKLYTLLSDETNGIVINLKEALACSNRLGHFTTDTKETENRLQTSYIDLKDLCREIEVQQNNIEFNPERLEFINQRLDTIYSLEQKHKVSDTSALLNLQQELENKLSKLENFEEEIQKLKNNLDQIEKKVIHSGKLLSEKRRRSSEKMTSELLPLLHQLNMRNGRFQVLITEKQEFQVNGMDEIDFLFSANEKSNMQSVSQIASGGEISRLMFGIKSLIADNKGLPSIILDEIDTGISGETAHKMAEIMLKMSKNMQVICITHLPQIGAKGEKHYKVFKENSTTHMSLLSAEERITEIALMLSGSGISDAAIENAKNLLT